MGQKPRKKKILEGMKLKESSQSLTMKDIPTNDRPRERLINSGSASLSDRELLAIILRTGTNSVTVTNMAEYLIKEFGSLDALDRASTQDICRIEGIGPAKAAQIKAALELGRRLRIEGLQKEGKIKSPQDLFEFLRSEMSALDHEEFKVILLDTKNRIIKHYVLYKGSLNSTSIRVAEVFKEALIINSASIIFAHNHPSGDPTPSEEDKYITKLLVEAGRLLEIDILDHIIVGKTCVSMRQLGFGFE